MFDSLRRRLPARMVWTPGLNRFAEALALSGAADALVAVSLAGSLFFSLSPDASQQQVLLYLVINMTPFVLLAPLIGPAIDRFHSGHRWIAFALFLFRAACAIGLALTLLQLGLYFFALALLVAAKATGVTKQALIPGLVESPEHLVAANSRLARMNVIAGGVGGAVGAGLVALTSPRVTLGVACAAFLAAGLATLRIPATPPAPRVLTPSVEYEELHAPTIVATAWAFTVIRSAVGFFVFGLAFALRRESEPAWMYATAVASYGVGSFGGNTIAPLLRRRYGEDRLTAGSLVTLAVVAAFGAIGSTRALILIVAFVLGAAASVGRQGFDAMVQTRAPRASHGRSFARFETRFQLGWVLGAIAATASGIPIQISMGVLAAALIPAAWRYERSIREGKEAHAEDPFDLVQVSRRRVDHAAEWRRRGLARVAVTELASVVELARATGFPVDDELVARIDHLRLTALGGEEPHPDDLWWALNRADDLVNQMQVQAARGRRPAAARRRRGRRRQGADVAVAAPGAGGDGDTSASTTDDDVTVHCDERRSNVTTRLDQSAAER